MKEMFALYFYFYSKVEGEWIESVEAVSAYEENLVALATEYNTEDGESFCIVCDGSLVLGETPYYRIKAIKTV